jgi:cholesterol oxidase
MFFNTSPAVRARRSLRAPAPSLHPFKTSDGVELLLTRYRGGNKGPVMLVHGLGVSSLIFSIDTINTNLLEYLLENHYDVWLIDYRSSIRLPAVRTQYTADEVAKIDLPQAVALVQQLTGQSEIQVVAHCYGGTTFSMAMLAGLTGVRSAVISQVSAHISAPPLVGFKAGLRTAEALEAIGISSLDASPDESTGWSDRLLDAALRLYPVESEEQCSSRVCRRITFMYSVLYEHDQLNEATHEALGEMFGEASMSALGDVTRLVRRGQLVDSKGNDVYLPHLDRMAIPIRFIHGAENACYLPASTERTFDVLRERNGSSLYSRVVIPNYGHIDCIFGKDASRDVYPHITEHLDAT